MIRKSRSFVFFLFVSVLLSGGALYFGQNLLQETVSTVLQQKEDIQNMDFDIVNKLVKQEQENGYTIETYQEYEVYKDANATIIKSVPTSEYHYLRYKSKENH